MVTTMLPRLERRSILTGAAVTILLALPPALIGLVRADDELNGSGWVPLIFFWTLAAFVVGGFVAARPQPHAPLAHGAVAVLLAYAVVQGIGAVVDVNDDGVAWLSIPFLALLAASTGMIGGMVADWLRARSAQA